MGHPAPALPTAYECGVTRNGMQWIANAVCAILLRRFAMRSADLSAANA
jgi:hypothetical protein